MDDRVDELVHDRLALAGDRDRIVRPVVTTRPDQRVAPGRRQRDGRSAPGGAGRCRGATRGAPSVTLTPTGCNSLVWAGGHDWTNDAIPVPGEGQTIVHKFIDTVVHDSFWVQAVTAPTEDGSPVTVSATGLVRDRWQLVAVEIPGANP